MILRVSRCSSACAHIGRSRMRSYLQIYDLSITASKSSGHSSCLLKPSTVRTHHDNQRSDAHSTENLSSLNPFSISYHPLSFIAVCHRIPSLALPIDALVTGTLPCISRTSFHQLGQLSVHICVSEALACLRLLYDSTIKVSADAGSLMLDGSAETAFYLRQ